MPLKVSVVIPAREEEENLRELLPQLRRAAAGLATELIVVDGGSRDRTLALAQELADLALRSPPGRARQMHRGAEASSGDVLLFLHADTRLPEGWREELERAWSGPKRPAATAFRLGFESPEPYYAWLARLARWRGRLTGVPHGDQGIAVGREEYFRVGGFPPVPLLEEYYLVRNLRRLGRPRLLLGTALSSVRRYERVGRVLNPLRNCAILLLFHFGVGPERLAKLYR